MSDVSLARRTPSSSTQTNQGEKVKESTGSDHAAMPSAEAPQSEKTKLAMAQKPAVGTPVEALKTPNEKTNGYTNGTTNGNGYFSDSHYESPTTSSK